MAEQRSRYAPSGLVSGDELDRLLAAPLAEADGRGEDAAVLIVRLDELATVTRQWGEDAARRVRLRASDRILSALRPDDVCAGDAETTKLSCTGPLGAPFCATIANFTGRARS